MEGLRMLPLAGEQPAERSDAARNREALLRAASELIEACSVENVTMDAVAQRAGVGKGTVFRRFESREGLMAALLDHSESAWQASVISGPPPLGPGAPPLERLHAFGRSRIHTTMTHAALIRAAGVAGSRAQGPISFAAMHVRYLLAELGVHGDLGYLATALLAPLEIPVLEQLLGTEGRPVEEVEAGWDDLVRRVVAPTPSPPEQPTRPARSGIVPDGAVDAEAVSPGGGGVGRR